MKHRKLWLILASLLSLALIASACGSDDDDDAGEPPPTTAATTTTEAATTTTEEPMDEEPMDEESMSGLEGTSVRIFGPESSDEEAGAFQDAVDVFGDRTGIDIEYVGARDFSDQINLQVTEGNAPDIAVFPQPGKVADFARDGFVLPLPDDVRATAEASWPASWNAFGVVDGVQYAIPTKADLKSLVWYQPARFEAAGYDIPETWDEFKDLVDEMIANGDTPLCVGIESGPATGWTFTDWIEDLMLRFHPPEQYDAWVAGDLPFSSPEVRQVWNEVLDLWNTEGAVFAVGGSIASTPFGASGAPLVAGDCFMHRQASFFAAFMPEGTPYADGSEEAVDVFYFPSVGEERPALVAGTIVAAFSDRPEVWAVMEYLASAEYATERQKAQKARTGNQLSGFLSAALNQDLSYYSPLEQSFLNILTTADIARFDASDLMPAAVGSGTFWSEGTAAVTGEKSVEEATADIDDSWPS